MAISFPRMKTLILSINYLLEKMFAFSSSLKIFPPRLKCYAVFCFVIFICCDIFLRETYTLANWYKYRVGDQIRSVNVCRT
ncbi:hypothetical protein XELAEV_18017878mg [Xenopus laevis]|uniref:Uncharacterized protein n=1 Tax=Xenopus laevis TaxID=8355 RepID=A0A974DBY8_XENLA|nr:hypothetical protein XELAEV_18017878mg [Xenopus laevis]